MKKSTHVANRPLYPGQAQSGLDRQGNLTFNKIYRHVLLSSSRVPFFKKSFSKPYERPATPREKSRARARVVKELTILDKLFSNNRTNDGADNDQPRPPGSGSLHILALYKGSANHNHPTINRDGGKVCHPDQPTIELEYCAGG